MLVKKDIDIILASKSPRRRELLTQIDIEYRCIPSTKEEIITVKEPVEVVKELSAQKAYDVEKKVIEETNEKSDIAKIKTDRQGNIGQNQPQAKVIIGADTVVAYNGEILGKPKDEEDAFRMLSMLSGKSHEVYTGVTVVYLSGYENYPRKEISFSECTKVYVAKLTERDIRNYISTGEPMDKAGAYGIQGRFGKYVTKIDGDYNNVVGLPIARLFNEVRDHLGINLSDGTLEKRNEVKAFIFDLDGTTLDTVESIGTTVNMVLKELQLPIHELEKYKKFAGDGQYELVKRSLVSAGDTELKLYDKAMARYIELFKDRCTYKVTPYEGIRELFDELKSRGIKLCIFSNKHHDNVVSLLNQIFGENYFDVILGQREDYHRKPSGEGLDIILSEAGVLACNCIYVGDTNTDMLTGKNYGLYTVGVTWGFRTEEELIYGGADYIAHKPEDIIENIHEDIVFEMDISSI